MKIVITGAKGNLGTTLKRLGSTHDWISIDQGDWNSLDRDLKNANVVIHTASDLLTPAWKDPQGVMDSNLMTTVRLLQSLQNSPQCRLVFTSSCAVYGRSEVTREDVEPAPISTNGVTKLLNEALIREFCTYHGITFQIFRLFNTYGGNDRFSIVHRLQESLDAKRPFTLNNDGISQRDFLHVEDAAQVILKLIEMPVHYPVMNIGSGEATRIRDIVTEFRKGHPKLEIATSSRPEAEYSRADIQRLREFLPSYSFRSVLDFVREV